MRPVIDHPLLLSLAVLLPIAVVVLGLAGYRRRRARLDRLGSPAMITRLVPPNAAQPPGWRATRLALAAALAGCLLWHKRCPSPHLATATAGLALLLVLTLPSLFEEMFGWDALEQFASSFIEPEADSGLWQGRSPGQLLLQRCQQFEWIGMAFLALVGLK